MRQGFPRPLGPGLFGLASGRLIRARAQDHSRALSSIPPTHRTISFQRAARARPRMAAPQIPGARRRVAAMRGPPARGGACPTRRPVTPACPALKDHPRTTLPACRRLALANRDGRGVGRLLGVPSRPGRPRSLLATASLSSARIFFRATRVDPAAEHDVTGRSTSGAGVVVLVVRLRRSAVYVASGKRQASRAAIGVEDDVPEALTSQRASRRLRRGSARETGESTWKRPAVKRAAMAPPAFPSDAVVSPAVTARREARAGAPRREMDDGHRR